jgi:hypothetical protein
VVTGLLAATFSSALASLVGAPRILHALAADNVTPASSWLARRNAQSEPRQALLIAIAVVVSAALLRDLNAITELITMVFLLTYGARLPRRDADHQPLGQRLQGPPELVLIERPFASALEQAPASTRLHVFALSSQTDFEWLREIRGRLEAPCIFVRDAGVENAFA